MAKKKVLYEIKKPRVRFYISFWTEDEDGWFIEITKHKNKTGEEIEYIGMITEKDFDRWKEKYESKGWVKKD